MVARYHHPGFGRFLSEDPIGSPAFGRCSAGSRDLTSSRLAEGNRRGDLKNLYAYGSVVSGSTRLSEIMVSAGNSTPCVLANERRGSRARVANESPHDSLRQLTIM